MLGTQKTRHIESTMCRAIILMRLWWNRKTRLDSVYVGLVACQLPIRIQKMNAPIRQVNQKRQEISFILATAIFLALAVNFAADYLSTIVRTDYLILHPITLSLICFFFGVFLLKPIGFFGSTDYIVRLRGAIFYNINDENIEPVEIIGYSFNDDFCGYLRAFLRENSAYRKLFSKGESTVIPMNQFDPDNLNHHTIINSTIEYTVLKKLALHLNGYFVKNEIDRSRIVTLTRDQLDAAVLKNRVIDQITKDMIERPVFSREPDTETEGRVVAVYDKDGAIFESLNIELPPNSKITRNSDGYLVITNPIFELTIIPKYEGFGTSLPKILTPSQNDIFQSPLLFSLKLHIRVKSKAYITNESMEIYGWLDSFVEMLHDYISKERLEKRLDVDLVKLLSSSSTNPASG